MKSIPQTNDLDRRALQRTNGSNFTDNGYLAPKSFDMWTMANMSCFKHTVISTLIFDVYIPYIQCVASSKY